jgi:arylsulfatase A-like enzyme
MAAALAQMASSGPDLAVVNLADVDRAGHAYGPESPQCERAVTGADGAIAVLVRHLRELGRWQRSVLIVTSDHGFTALAPTVERPYPVITIGRELWRTGVKGVRVVADGGVEHVYAEGLAAGAAALGGTAEVLAKVAGIARETPGVAEVLARLPLEGFPSLGTAHPEWHVAHQRSGELLLVAAPGYQFVDPFDPVDAGLLGNHGGPQDLGVPLLVTGGSSAVVSAGATFEPATVDVAPTIAALLELRQPRRLDGASLASDVVGRPLTAVLAGAPGQSPH